MNDVEAEYDRIPYEDRNPANYRFLTELSIEQEMLRLMTDTRDIYARRFENITLGECRILLQKYNWDRRKLLMEQKQKSVIDMLTEAKLKVQRPNDRNKAEGYPCMNCKKAAPHITVVGLPCGHMACADCWKKNLSSQFKNQLLKIYCHVNGCERLVISDDKIKMLIKLTPLAADFLLEFNAWRRNVYIYERKFVKCRKSGCLQYVQILANTQPIRWIKCRQCKRDIYTSSCCQSWHEPIPCELRQMWKKYQPDKEARRASADPLGDHYKRCPNCQRPFERDGGCQKIQCTAEHCKTEFCYECLALWNENHDKCSKKLEQEQCESVSLEEKNLFRDRMFEITYDACQKYNDSSLRGEVISQGTSNWFVVKQKRLAMKGLIIRAQDLFIDSGADLSNLRIFYFFVKFDKEEHIATFNEHVSQFERCRDALGSVLLENLRGVKRTSIVKKWIEDVRSASSEVTTNHRRCMDLVQRYTAARDFKFRVRFSIPEQIIYTRW